jgi:hypothetical protein
MITELYTFTPGFYVVADEWNANFSVLSNVAEQHNEAVIDGYNLLAFPNGDLSGVFENVDARPNSVQFTGTSIAILSPNMEYWQNRLETITADQQLVIRVGKINGEARVFFQTSSTRDIALPPFLINYDGGDANIDFVDDSRVWQDAGIKCLLFYELNDKLNVRMVKAG